MSTPNIDACLRRWASTAPPPRDTLHAMVLQAKGGAKEDIDLVCTYVYGYVVGCLGAYQVYLSHPDDSFQEGCLAILGAIEKFDPKRPNPSFLNLLSLEVRHRIRELAVHLGVKLRPPRMRTMQIVRAYAERHHLDVCDLDVQSVCRETGLKPLSVRRAMADCAVTVPLDGPTAVPCHEASGDELCARNDEYAAVREAIDARPRADRECVRLIYGIGIDAPLSVPETARRLGHSSRWVYKVLDRALPAIRSHLAATGA